jgi:heme-degrading monooxygenase HmoA
MTTQDSFVVTNQATYQPELKDKVMHLAYTSMPVYKRQEGLIYVGIHHHLSEPKLITYLVWETEEHYLRCLSNDDFSSIASQWNEMITRGKVTLEVSMYSVIDSYSKHAEPIF